MEDTRRETTMKQSNRPDMVILTAQKRRGAHHLSTQCFGGACRQHTIQMNDIGLCCRTCTLYMYHIFKVTVYLSMREHRLYLKCFSWWPDYDRNVYKSRIRFSSVHNIGGLFYPTTWKECCHSSVSHPSHLRLAMFWTLVEHVGWLDWYAKLLISQEEGLLETRCICLPMKTFPGCVEPEVMSGWTWQKMCFEEVSKLEGIDIGWSNVIPSRISGIRSTRRKQSRSRC